MSVADHPLLALVIILLWMAGVTGIPLVLRYCFIRALRNPTYYCLGDWRGRQRSPQFKTIQEARAGLKEHPWEQLHIWGWYMGLGRMIE